MAEESKSTKTVNLMTTAKVSVRRGASVQVEVPSKGATGHVWSVKTDPTKVRVVEHHRQPSEAQFGGGGTEIFTLESLEPGASTVIFQLGAPWRSAPAEEHRLDVFANDGN